MMVRLVSTLGLRLLAALCLLACRHATASPQNEHGLRGQQHPSRGLQSFFEPFGASETKYGVTKAPTPSRAPSVFKSTKGPKSTKAPTTSRPSRSPTVKGSGKGSGSPTISRSSLAPAVKGTEMLEAQGSVEEAPTGGTEEEEVSYELFEDSTAKTLPVSAFLVTTASTFVPLSTDFEEFAKVVRAVFQEMYGFKFADASDCDFVGVFLPRYTIVAPTLVDFEVNVYFSNKKTVPSLFQVESVAKQGFQPSAEFYNLLLGRMRAMQSRFYSQATTVQYLTNTQDLNMAVLALSNGNTYTTGQLILIIMLTLFGAAVFALCVILLLKKRKNQRRTHVQEEHSLIDVKMDKNMDYPDSYSHVTRATYTSDAQQTISPRPPPQHNNRTPPPITSVTHSLIPSSPRSKTAAADDDDDDDEFMLDENLTFDDVALEEESTSDAKTRIGEIRKSAFVNDCMVTSKTQPRLDTAKHVGELSPRASSDIISSGESSGGVDEAQENKSRVAEINRAKYKNKLTRSMPVKSPYPGSPKPWHTEGGLPPVPESPESPYTAGPLNDAPQRIFHVSSPSPPSGPASGTKTKPSATAIDDDASVLTIDSQSSATPEFLKKFKQMGLKRPKGENP